VHACLSPHTRRPLAIRVIHGCRDAAYSTAFSADVSGGTGAATLTVADTTVQLFPANPTLIPTTTLVNPTAVTAPGFSGCILEPPAPSASPAPASGAVNGPNVAHTGVIVAGVIVPIIVLGIVAGAAYMYRERLQVQLATIRARIPTTSAVANPLAAALAPAYDASTNDGMSARDTRVARMEAGPGR
jgi:hypothetical protein